MAGGAWADSDRTFIAEGRIGDQLGADGKEEVVLYGDTTDSPAGTSGPSLPGQQADHTWANAWDGSAWDFENNYSTFNIEYDATANKLYYDIDGGTTLEYMIDDSWSEFVFWTSVDGRDKDYLGTRIWNVAWTPESASGQTFAWGFGNAIGAGAGWDRYAHETFSLVPCLEQCGDWTLTGMVSFGWMSNVVPVGSDLNFNIAGFGDAENCLIPEPATMSLLGLGLAGMLVARARRRRS